MVTTRRSASLVPTIALARALRRERRARIAEAELLPQSQSIATRSRGGHGQRTKEARASAKKTGKKKAAKSSAITTNPDSLAQSTLAQDPSSLFSQETVQPPCPDASQNPPPASQAHEDPSPHCASQVNTLPVALSQASISQANASQVYLSPDPSYSNSQAIAQVPFASQNPSVCPQPRQTTEDFFNRESTPQINLPLDNDSIASSPETSQHPFLNESRSLSGYAPPDVAVKLWFQSTSTSHLSVPNSGPPAFTATNNLVDFSTGVQPPEEKKPFDQQARANNRRHNDFLSTLDEQQRVSAYVARRREAIGKAATAVMAHMNGEDVSRSDYLQILDGMLTDPDMRERLPPVLIERYEIAAKENPKTLYNGGLIDKFVTATHRATNVTARIIINSTKTKRERRTRGMRPRPLYKQSSAFPSSQQLHRAQTIPGSSNTPRSAFTSDLFAGPPSSHRPTLLRLFPEPLTEANLSRAPDCTTNRKANGSVDEDRGVMRTSKGSVRASPYPRRESTDSFRMTQNIAGSAGNMHHKETNEECDYSIYSGSVSTGLHNQQAEAKKMAQSMLDGVQSMLEPDSYDAQCVRNAEAILEETARRKGDAMAASVRRGFDLIHCYDLIKQVNVDLLSEALLEHISEAPRPRDQRPPNSLQVMNSYENLPQPPPQYCEHGQLGRGWVTYSKVFHPVGPNDQNPNPSLQPLRFP